MIVFKWVAQTGSTLTFEWDEDFLTFFEEGGFSHRNGLF